MTSDVVEVRIRVAAYRATIFKFLSDPDLFRQWMGDATLGVGVGQLLTVRYPDGDWALGTIEEIVSDKRVVFSWGYADPAKNLPPKSSRVSIDLASIPWRHAHYAPPLRPPARNGSQPRDGLETLSLRARERRGISHGTRRGSS